MWMPKPSAINAIPIIIKKDNANMITVGFLSINLESTPAAVSINDTATITAKNMIGT